MMDDDLCFLSLAELASLMRARTVSAAEVTEARSEERRVGKECRL